MQLDLKVALTSTPLTKRINKERKTQSFYIMSVSKLPRVQPPTLYWGIG